MQTVKAKKGRSRVQEVKIGDSAAPPKNRVLLKGEGRYVGDIDLPNQIHLAVVRSQVPHGRLVRVDVKPALQIPGVVDAFSARDIRQYLGPIAARHDEPGIAPFFQHTLALDRVRYVGEPLAVVLADSPYAAEDAADAVMAEIDALPAHGSVNEALARGAEPLFDASRENMARELLAEKGSLDAAFESADLVIEEDFSIGRHSGIPVETRGLLASWNAGDETLTVWGPTKIPHWARSVLARLLSLPEERIRFLETDVGGGFGVRGEFYPEDLLVPLASIRTRRPVKWIEDRREHMLAANHSRELYWKIRLALSNSGEILGLDARLDADVGAYIGTHGTLVPRLAAQHLIGPYAIEASRCEIRSVLTNKTPMGTVRSPGRFEATFARERIIDIAAHRLEMDPAELRARNFVKSDRIPGSSGLSVDGQTLTVDSGDFFETFNLALERVNYHQFRDTKAGRSTDSVKVGIGLSSFVEKTGAGPPESARISVDSSGRVHVMTGAPSMGQGHEIAFAQIAADALGVPLAQVVVDPLDTDVMHSGGGTFASRGVAVAGGAIHRAGLILRERILVGAAGVLDTDPASLELADGIVRGTSGGQQLSLLEIVQSLAGDEITAEASFQLEDLAVTYGTVCAIVEVDTETGGITVQKAVIVVDAGKCINPAMVEGQLRGGFIQGMGGALLEEFSYTDDGQPQSTTLMDYLMPTAQTIPDLEVVALERHPSPNTPLGAKGMGEVGTQGVGGAIANAVADAIGEEGGRVIRVLPLSPQRVLTAIGRHRQDK